MKKLLLLALLASSCSVYAGDKEEEKSDSLVAAFCCEGEVTSQETKGE